MILVAHRGESYIAPENTLAALKLAWDWGAKAAEVDVHMSLDRRIMVIHDPHTGRVASEQVVVKDTNSADLRKLDVGSWKGKEYAGEKIPYLEEVLAMVPAGCALLLEVKCGAEALPLIRDVLDASGKRSQVLPISFDLDLVSRAKKLMPDLEALQIRSTPRDPDTGKSIPYTRELIQRALDAGIDGLNLELEMVTPEYADMVHAAGLKLWTWIANDPAVARRQAKLGVERLGTDRRAWMQEQLEK